MNVGSQIVSFVDRLQLQAEAPQAPMPEAPGAIGDRIRALIDLLRDGFANIDEEEAAAIFAKMQEAAALFAAGNWIGGTFAVMAAMKMYREAKRD